MAKGFKELSNLWDKISKDEQNRMLEELYNGVEEATELAGEGLKENSVGTLELKKEAVTKDKMAKNSVDASILSKDSVDNTKIQKETVRMSKTNFIKEAPIERQENLFDVNDFESVYYANGSVQSHPDYVGTKLIPIKKGQTLSCWNQNNATNVIWAYFDLNKKFVENKTTSNYTAASDGYVVLAIPKTIVSVFSISDGLSAPQKIETFKHYSERPIQKKQQNDDSLIGLLNVQGAVETIDNPKISTGIEVKFSSGSFNYVGIAIPFELTQTNFFDRVVLKKCQAYIDGVLVVGISKKHGIFNKRFENEFPFETYSKFRMSKDIEYDVIPIELDTYLLPDGIYHMSIHFVPDGKYPYGTKVFDISNVNNMSNANINSDFWYPNKSNREVMWLPNSSFDAMKWISLSRDFDNDYKFIPYIELYDTNPLKLKPNNQNSTLMPTYSDFEIPIIEGDETHIYYDGLINAKEPSNYSYQLENMKNYRDKFIKFRGRKAVVDTTQGTPTSNNYNINVIDDFDSVIGKFKLDIKLKKAVNPTTKKNILLIGDSLLEGIKGDRGRTAVTLNNKLKQFNLNNYQIVGTLDSIDPLVKHEGRGGWQASDYLNPSKTGNPFAVDGKIDFKAYCQNNNFSGLDVVFIHLNWNSFTYFENKTIANNMKALSNLISKDYPNAKIFIVGLANYSKNLYNEWGSSTKIEAWNLDRQYEKIAKENNNWQVCHLMPFIDIEFGNQIIEIETNPRSPKKEKAMGDFVHMGNEEYDQIADVYFRYLIACF